ncbi:MAG: hypothetical protein ACI81T_002993 [Bacteroidia bacterium]|jgi:hypothetical protein
MKNKLPIILLAFANEKEDESAYLRELTKEQRLIRNQLQKLKDNAICEVEHLPNVTLKEIFNTFQNENYRGRICLFHYGGHASSFQLLLESEEGGNALAHGDGLMGFLKKQQKNGLKVIILNGCATEQHAHALAEAGIATIATSGSINDEVATKFAERLYLGIANQIPLQQAFEEASDFIKSEKGTADKKALYRDLSWEGMGNNTVETFPWKLHLPLSPTEKLADWTIQQSHNTLNLSEAEFAKIAFEGLKKENEIDAEKIKKGLTKYLIESVNLRKTVSFLETELVEKETAIENYIRQIKNEVGNLKKLSRKGEYEAVDKRKDRLIREIWETFS